MTVITNTQLLELPVVIREVVSNHMNSGTKVNGGDMLRDLLALGWYPEYFNQRTDYLGIVVHWSYSWILKFNVWNPEGELHGLLASADDRIPEGAVNRAGWAKTAHTHGSTAFHFLTQAQREWNGDGEMRNTWYELRDSDRERLERAYEITLGETHNTVSLLEGQGFHELVKLQTQEGQSGDVLFTPGQLFHRASFEGPMLSVFFSEERQQKSLLWEDPSRVELTRPRPVYSDFNAEQQRSILDWTVEVFAS